jgi:iron complex outermembrane receptor protein
LETLIESLHSGGYSCVIRKGDETRTFRQRGVKDLWELCQSQDLFLNGAIIADKVVVKGAAALMILGRIKEVYADVISTPAVDLLKEHGIKTSINETTDRIINRQGNGLCPVETLCINLQSVNEMYEVITNFLKQNR